MADDAGYYAQFLELAVVLVLQSLQESDIQWYDHSER